VLSSPNRDSWCRAEPENGSSTFEELEALSGVVIEECRTREPNSRRTGQHAGHDTGGRGLCRCCAHQRFIAFSGERHNGAPLERRLPAPGKLDAESREEQAEQSHEEDSFVVTAD
jgi:hypothetical protein